MGERGVHCPHCPYTHVRRCRWRWYEWPLALILLRPYRCKACGYRFYDRLVVEA